MATYRSMGVNIRADVVVSSSKQSHDSSPSSGKLPVQPSFRMLLVCSKPIVVRVIFSRLWSQQLTLE